MTLLHTCTPDTNVLIIHYDKYKNDKRQRILSGKCTVLCYILEYNI